MKLSISDDIFEKYPTLNLGVVFAKNIDNTGEKTEVLTMLNDQVKTIASTYELDTLKDLPKLQSWRQAYADFGAKPKKYTCSVENLHRMILEGVSLQHINTLVDIYNYISLKHMVPVGGDDLDKIDGNITLKFATGSEPFVRLNSDEIDYPKIGEVIYTDDREVLCRRWNWRESDKSKMTEQTKNVALVIEGLAPVTAADVQLITQELAGLVEKYCGGSTSTHLLNSGSRELELNQL